jgi:hypothetical protein
VLDVGLPSGQLAGARRDHVADRQVELLRELVVALVVGGHGHDRAGAVAGQHVVGDPDRDALAVDRVDRVAPMKTPVFSRSVFSRSISVSRRAAATYASTSARRSSVVSRSTSGCSGARTMKVAPNSVSGRVVKTRIGSTSSGSVGKSISAPSERPIQFVCIALIGSGQSMPSKSAARRRSS